MSTSKSHYVKELTEQLRINGLPESRVREIIGEVQGHLAATDEDPVVTFGQPVDYATQWVRLSPGRWVSKVLLGAVAALGIVCGVRALFADQPWDGGVAMGPPDLVQFAILFGVLGVLPWTVGLFESRRRASRLGESTIPSSWPLRIGAVVVIGILAALLTGLVDQGASEAGFFEVPRWSLVAVAVLGLSVVFFMGPTPNSSGYAPEAPGPQGSSWRMRVRRWLG